MRRISIGFASQDQMVATLQELLDQAEAGDEPQQVFRGNAGPDLSLEFVNENDPEFPEPLVDYLEG